MLVQYKSPAQSNSQTRKDAKLPSSSYKIRMTSIGPRLSLVINHIRQGSYRADVRTLRKPSRFRLFRLSGSNLNSSVPCFWRSLSAWTWNSASLPEGSTFSSESRVVPLKHMLSYSAGRGPYGPRSRLSRSNVYVDPVCTPFLRRNPPLLCHRLIRGRRSRDPGQKTSPTSCI